MSLLTLFCGTMFAQEVTLDFTTNTWGLPEGSGNKLTELKDFTNGTYTISLEGASSGYYFNADGYLMLGKANATLTLPAFDFDVEKIEVVGNGGASAYVQQNFFVGDAEVSTATKGAATEDKKPLTNTYVIADGYQKAGNKYTLKVLSKHNTQITYIKVYKKNGVSKKSADLKFSETDIEVEQGKEFTAPTFTKATTASVKFVSDNEAVASVNSEGKITLGSELGTAVITATSEENDEYAAGKATCTVEVYKNVLYKKATAIKSGSEYLIVAQRDGNTYYAMPADEDKTYGYFQTSKIEGAVDEINVKSKYNDGFVFTTEGEGYSIKDCYGRYLYHDGEYKTFSLGQDAQAWTVEPQADGTFKISYSDGYYVQFGDGTYTSFGVYPEARDNAVMPLLYEKYDQATGINGVETENKVNADAPVYNLAGQRVSKNAKGILIHNGKKFINK